MSEGRQSVTRPIWGNEARNVLAFLSSDEAVGWKIVDKKGTAE